MLFYLSSLDILNQLVWRWFCGCMNLKEPQVKLIMFLCLTTRKCPNTFSKFDEFYQGKTWQSLCDNNSFACAVSWVLCFRCLWVLRRRVWSPAPQITCSSCGETENCSRSCAASRSFINSSRTRDCDLLLNATPNSFLVFVLRASVNEHHRSVEQVSFV